jgi:xylan 1,4-beta-xylosidase
MYASYTAASFPRLQALAQRHALNLEGVLTWAFEFEDQPYFAGFRQLTSAGIDLPVMNVFKLFSRMTGTYVPAISDHETALDDMMRDGVRGASDVASVATRDGDRVAVLVWHYHDDDLAGPDAKVSLDVSHLPRAFAGGAQLTHYRVDNEHANAYAAWLKMGSPIAPTEGQRKALLDAAKLATLEPSPTTLTVKRGDTRIDFVLPRQGVSLLVLTPETR